MVISRSPFGFSSRGHRATCGFNYSRHGSAGTKGTRLPGRGRNAARSASFFCQGAGGASRQILSHRTFLCAVRPYVRLSICP
ncbi:hypothetical protein DBV15_07871 [Temnothorax longispinosus]|uniref:Uncharacterized protein n=1 Tax=Temnothorax longispinosus TaxID=300112 RepID=A0A4V3S6D7_9HYME|nr:hypothetical protein DBV15_07871 [Temnothorax longispinosus]